MKYQLNTLNFILYCKLYLTTYFTVTKIITVTRTVYSVQFTLSNDHCSLYTVHCTCVHGTLYNFTLYTVHCTTHSTASPLHHSQHVPCARLPGYLLQFGKLATDVHFDVCSAQCKVCIVNCEVSYLHYTVSSVPCDMWCVQFFIVLCATQALMLTVNWWLQEYRCVTVTLTSADLWSNIQYKPCKH